MSKIAKHSQAFNENYNPKSRISRGLSYTLTQADTVLLGKRTEVSVVNPNDFRWGYGQHGHQLITGGHTHYSGGNRRRSVVLPSADFGVSKDPVVTTLGYNYHFIGHRKFSPRLDDTTLRRHTPSLSGANNLGYADDLDLQTYFANIYSMFECARVERLMIAAFPSTRQYFVASTFNKVSTILEQAVAAKGQPAVIPRRSALFASYLYLALRPYMARSIRARALTDMEAEFQVQIDDRSVATVLSSYLNLTYEKGVDNPEKWFKSATADTYLDLLKVLPRSLSSDIRVAITGEYVATCSSSMPHDNTDGGKDDQQSLQRAAQKSQDSSEGDEDEQDEDQPSDGQNGEEEKDGEGQGGSEGEGEEDGDQAGGSSAGTGKGDNQSGDGESQSLEDMINDGAETAIQKAMDNESSRREVEDIRQNVHGSGLYSQNSSKSYKKRQPNADYILLQRLMAREFGKIVEDSDPSFVTHQPSGRVSMKRAMHGVEDYDTAFDVWDEGKLSASSMEVVLLIDNSGSMNLMMDRVCQAAWAISRGIESLGDSARVTTIYFNSGSEVVKTAQTRETATYTSVNSTGGTDPLGALVDAKHILSESNRAHRLCFILTDGVWSSTRNDDGVEDTGIVIRSMSAAGVKVGLANMFDHETYRRMHGQYDLSHGADVVARTETAKDFVEFARSIVKEAMNS